MRQRNVLTLKLWQLPIIDAPGFDIRPFFDEACNFIDDAVRHKSRILVHCVAGVSRSVSCVLAWLMNRQRVRLRAAFKQVGLFCARVCWRGIAQPS